MKFAQITAYLILGTLGTVQAHPKSILAQRDILQSMGEHADDWESRYNPALDYDRDSCYNAVAIDSNGNINPGTALTSSITGNCRTEAHLHNNQVYSRRRCNNGICAIMYEFYFEKDQWGHSLGHEHDWENVIVFIENNQPIRVSPSCHGKYGGASNNFLHHNGKPYMVYHKDGATTHCFRHAKKKDVDNPENHFPWFISSPVIGYNNWPNQSLYNRMLNAWTSDIRPKLSDDDFPHQLYNAASSYILSKFNPWVHGISVNDTAPLLDQALIDAHGDIETLSTGDGGDILDGPVELDIPIIVGFDGPNPILG